MIAEEKALLETEKSANLGYRTSDFVLVSRKELEQEHRTLIRRIQEVRRLLGYKPLATGKQDRKG